MKSSTVCIRTTILPGGKIEVSSPQLSVGDTVEVIVRPESPAPERRSALDILEELPGGILFKTPEEADAYLQNERDSWEH